MLFTGPPIIITHPTNETVNATTSVTLNCEGTGQEPITYLWQISSIDGGPWMDITDGKKLLVRNSQQSERYRCIVSNEAGTTTSNTAIVTLMGKLASLSIFVWCLTMVLTEIITQPTSPLTVTALEDATLTCLSSVDDATYSWHRVVDSVPSRSIGQNNNTLTIPRATPYDAGMYYCVVERNSISVESDKAVVSVDGK